MANGKEIRDLLIKIKSTGGKEAFKLLDDIDKKVAGGINKNLKKTNTNLNTIGRTIKRRVKDFEELKAAAKGTSSLGVANKSTTTAMKQLGAALQSVETNLKSMNNTMNTTMKSVDSSMKDMNTTMGRMLTEMEYAGDLAHIQSEEFGEIARETRDATKAQEKYRRGNTKLGNQFKHTNSKGRGQAKMFSALASSGGGLVGLYASLAANIFILDSAFRALKESADLIRLEENISVLGKGRNLRGLAIELQEISGYALSLDVALRTAAQSAAYGFDGKTMKEFTKGAKQASIALGIDFNDALTRLTKGIAKQEVELLDELGIVTRLEPAMIKYANAHKKTVQQLTDVERKTALAVESMLQLKNAYGEITTTSTEYEKVSAGIASITREMGKQAAEATEPLIALVNLAIKPFIEASNAAALGEGALSGLKNAKGLTAVATAYSEGSKAIEAQKKRILELEKIRDNASESARSLAKSGKYQLGMVSMLINAVTGADKVRDAVEEIDKLKESIDKISSAMDNAKPNTKGQTQETVSNLKAVQDAFADNFQKIAQFSATATKETDHYAEQLSHAKDMARNLAGAYTVDNAEAMKEEKKLVNAINDALGTSLSSVSEYVDALSDLSRSSTGFEQMLTAMEKTNWATDKSVTLLEKEKLLAINISKALKVGNSALANKLSLQMIQNGYAIEEAKRAEERNKNNSKIEASLARQMLLAGERGATESSNIAKEIEALNSKLSLNSQFLTDLEKQTLETEKQLLITKKDIALRKEAAAIKAEKSKGARGLATLSNDTTGAPASANLGIETQAAQEAYDLAMKKEDILAQEVAYNALLLAQEKERIALVKEKNNIGGSAALTSMFGNEKLRQGQENEDLGNEEASIATAVGDIEAVHSALAALDTDMGNLTGGFMELGQIMSQSMQNGALSAEGAAASIQAVAGIMSSVSSMAVGEIDHQIAMEQKRDGQSAKSVAKIAELEEKKRKEQQKTALQVAVMQTAAGITMALGSLPPPYSFVMAGLTAAMGLAQVSAIRSKGKNAAALASAGSGSNQSIEFGSRMNNVDVSQTANAGERAFVTGQAGSGTNANNFTGAASGAHVQGGTAVNVGERGGEVFIPDVPGTIVPSGDVKQGSGSSGLSVQIYNDNIDAQSMIDRSEDILEAMEVALRAKYGKSMEDM